MKTEESHIRCPECSYVMGQDPNNNSSWVCLNGNCRAEYSFDEYMVTRDEAQSIADAVNQADAINNEAPHPNL